MLPGPPELEIRYRRFLEGRGDAIAPLLCYVRSDRGARTDTGAWAALIISRIFYLRGNLSLSRPYLRVASALCPSAYAGAGAGMLRLGLLVNHALILKAHGRTDEAARLLRSVVDRALRNDEGYVAAKAASNLAICLARIGQAENAVPYLGLAERYHSATGDTAGLIRVNMTCALVDMKQGRYDEAADRLYAALPRCTEVRSARERLAGLLLLAETFTVRGDLERAREALDNAASMEEALSVYAQQRLTWLRLESTYHRKTGNVDESRRLSGLAEALRRRLGISGLCDAIDRPDERSRPVAREAALDVSLPSARGAASNESAETFLTCDPRMIRLLEEIERAARLSLPILIEGESGTGKDLIARLVHCRSGRRHEPFIPVNAAALPVELFESLAFGHARGAFTGAVDNRAGLAASAGRGTLFLDEIGELSPAVQAKILRLIDRREYIPVGETKPRHFEGRIVAATNRDLKADCTTGRFRPDLYYRLAPLVFRIPPLRERRGDIACLAEHFVERLRSMDGRGRLRLHESALAALAGYSWPGNVRELESEILRASLRAKGGLLRACHLSPALVMRAAERASPPEAHLNARVVSLERAAILEELHASGGNKSEAARRLGLKRTTLLSAMKRLGVDW
ncbi:MAG: sigma-54 dependent transcriptional regulator [Candidatus Krumholzibacteria bacterium]|nr:sigma-54 dependent transcriptional regulator [Candidatus Krumholzibacteria bacterium]